MDTKKCIVGRLVDTQCGDHQFVRNELDAKDLSDTDKKILAYRIVNFPDNPIGVICPRHRVNTLDNFSVYQTKCFDPLQKHGAAIKLSLREVSLTMCEDFYEAKNMLVPPGSKVCINCLKFITEEISNMKIKQQKANDIVEQEVLPSRVEQPLLEDSIDDSEEIYNVPAEPSSTDSSVGFVTESQEQNLKEKKLKRILDEVNLPLPKRPKLHSAYQEKVSADLAQSVYERVLDQINDTFNTNVDAIEMRKLQRDQQSLQAMIENLKSYYEQLVTHTEKIKALTLFPSDWTHYEIKQHVDCSSYMIRKANKLRERKGVLKNPDRKKITRFSNELTESIVDFYRSNSRVCPGAKECVTVYNEETKQKEKLPKLLLLCTVRELYNKFVEYNMDDLEKVPGFSFFASLRPKDVKLAGDPGTHTVCVCGEHQNMKLKCRALSLDLEYRKLLSLCVCSVDNEFCMLYDCPNCPGPTAIKDYLKNKNLMKESGTVTYFNWLPVNVNSYNSDETHSCSRVTLQSATENADKFFDQFITDVWNLRKHHYVSESQKNYFDDVKKNLEYGTGLMMMDFAENYTFIAQDSTQAFYFNNKQATIHPFVLYYRDETGVIQHASFCVISDYLKHNAYVVNLFQEKVIEDMKNKFPWIKKLIYFSDGAPTQYKNKNNFANICAHEADFGIKIECYNFFATSHGKGPCDGIGAVAKRLVRDASLVLPPEKQILDPSSMYEFLHATVTATRFLWASSVECAQRERKLKKRFDAAKTVDSTRGYHYVKPIDERRAKFKLISLSKEFKVEAVMK